MAAAANRLADLRLEIELSDARPLHRRHVEYELRREQLQIAIADAERSYEELVERLARMDREAERIGARLRRPGTNHEPPAPAARRRAQRSSTTISVAHATAS